MTKFLEKELINEIKFHCKNFIEFNSKIEIRTLKVYKQKRKKNLLKFKNIFLLFLDNDWLNFQENTLSAFLISDLTSKKKYVLLIEIQYFINGLKEEKLVSYYEINEFWKKLLISKHNITATENRD